MIEDSLPRIAAQLRVDEKALRKHLASRSLQAVESCGFSFLRFKHSCANVEEGTMVFQTAAGLEYVRGFPKIRRVYDLAAGLKAHMPGKFYAEEKMDGYNVRCVSVDSNFAAITKGGLVCPYTTENLNHIVRTGFFKDFPNMMMCGEVVGLANPYQTKSYPHARDFGFFIFDIRDRTTGKPVPVAKRYALVKKYKLNGVRSFGMFTARDAGKLLRNVRKLGDKKGEGFVFKSEDSLTQLKYTCNQSTNRDLIYAFTYPFDYAQAFFFRRIIREAFQAHELKLNGTALKREAARLGESLLIPLVETVGNVSRGKEVTEDFDLVVSSPDFGREFVAHLQHLGVKASVAGSKKQGKRWKLRVKRHYPASNDKIKSYLKGEFGSE